MNEALQAQMCKCLECAHKAGTGSVPFLLPPRMRSRPGPWIARSTVPTCGDRWRGVNPLDTCTGKSLLCSGKRSGSESGSLNHSRGGKFEVRIISDAESTVEEPLISTRTGYLSNHLSRWEIPMSPRNSSIIT